MGAGQGGALRRTPLVEREGRALAVVPVCVLARCSRVQTMWEGLQAPACGPSGGR
jgi:hypothetical protein